MKKINQTRQLRKLKTKLNEESLKFLENNEFLVWYKDNNCENVYCKDDLIRILEKDHIKPIRYIFDMTDRIIVDRDVQIDVSQIEKNM